MRSNVPCAINAPGVSTIAKRTIARIRIDLLTLLPLSSLVGPAPAAQTAA
jgi:hypothetical protein